MDPIARKRLEERVFAAVHGILVDGDRPYLLSLSPSAFVEGLASELYFLGLYRAEDRETREWIQTILTRQAETWRAALQADAFSEEYA
jgi:hypothetical protein